MRVARLAQTVREAAKAPVAKGVTSSTTEAGSAWRPGAAAAKPHDAFQVLQTSKWVSSVRLSPGEVEIPWTQLFAPEHHDAVRSYLLDPALQAKGRENALLIIQTRQGPRVHKIPGGQGMVPLPRTLATLTKALGKVAPDDLVSVHFAHNHPSASQFSSPTLSHEDLMVAYELKALVHSKTQRDVPLVMSAIPAKSDTAFAYGAASRHPPRGLFNSRDVTHYKLSFEVPPDFFVSGAGEFPKPAGVDLTAIPSALAAMKPRSVATLGASTVTADGSSQLRFYRSSDLAPQRLLNVVDRGEPVHITSLTATQDKLYARTPLPLELLEIDPQTGAVLGRADLRHAMSRGRYQLALDLGLDPASELSPDQVRFNSATQVFELSSKHWPTVFAVKLDD